MTIYYLMVKTHNITGLKYLCQTKRKDPHKYLGSGKYWKLHLKKHGKDIRTEILKECSTKPELREWGIHYSELWNIVESPDWANLRPEEGDGGLTVFGDAHHMKKEEYRRHLRENVWTLEKRKKQSGHSLVTNKLRDQENVSTKLKACWTTGRKNKHSVRMTVNNPMHDELISKKVADKNRNNRDSIISKISGDNHYKRNPQYVQTQAGKNHPNFNSTVYTFYNKNTYITENLTVFELQTKYNLNQGNLSLLLSGRRKSVGGWKLV